MIFSEFLLYISFLSLSSVLSTQIYNRNFRSLLNTLNIWQPTRFFVTCSTSWCPNLWIFHLFVRLALSSDYLSPLASFSSVWLAFLGRLSKFAWVVILFASFLLLLLFCSSCFFMHLTSDLNNCSHSKREKGPVAIFCSFCSCCCRSSNVLRFHSKPFSDLQFFLLFRAIILCLLNY